MSTISENIKTVRSRIAAAAERSGRDEKDIELICVTKTRTVEEIKEAIEAGVVQLGENRVQELMEKYDKIQDIANTMHKKPNIMWNLIGHLQRNKIKYVAGKVALIHSVDSFKLAEEINARQSKIGEPSHVLIQLNAGDESQKSGVSFDDCEALADLIDESLPYVQLNGLMVVVPLVDNPEDVRGYFRDAKKMFDKLAAKRLDGNKGFRHLSMGMTHDFEVAVEEGATMVRVGTAIFGPRSI